MTLLLARWGRSKDRLDRRRNFGVGNGGEVVVHGRPFPIYFPGNIPTNFTAR